MSSPNFSRYTANVNALTDLDYPPAQFDESDEAPQRMSVLRGADTRKYVETIPSVGRFGRHANVPDSYRRSAVEAPESTTVSANPS